MSKVRFHRFTLIILSLMAVLGCVSHLQTPPEIETTLSPLLAIPQLGNGYGSGPDQLAQPDDVEIMRNGNIVISDVDNNRVQLFDSEGLLIKSISGTSLGLENLEIIPTGIASDAEGYIYITFEGLGTIARFDGDLNFDQFIGYQGKVSSDDYYLPINNGLLMKPQGIIVSKQGDVYVIDMAKKIFEKEGVKNFGFRKFKQVVSDSGISYTYDTDFALTQEITKVMRKSEGMAISEEKGILFVAEEKPSKDQFNNINKYRYIGLFDLETGKFTGRLMAVDMLDDQITTGTTSESIEGLSVHGNLLFAVAEKAGRVDGYNIDTGERIISFGKPAPFYCDDESDCVIDGVNYNEQSIMSGVAKVHLLNNFKENELASPDGICATTLSNGKGRLAVVDQWNSRVLLYDLALVMAE